jgi:RecB family exonuclease
MHPLIGLEFSGATLTPFDDLAPGQGALGRPVWGPTQLLRDLELRLGLDSRVTSDAVRTARFAARMAQCGRRGRFYSASFGVDPLGTAQAVLGMRDALVEADWSGGAVPLGGARLEALAELEGMDSPALPSGLVDRVAVAARWLEGDGGCLYEQLTLAEGRELWSASWNRVFDALQRRGCHISQLTSALPGAPLESDLGRVQAALGSSAPRVAPPLAGDGTFILLTAETSLEAARATAAILSTKDAASSVVIRDGDASSLDYSLCLQGLPTQGLQATNRWRAALQLLPLALELAFQPKDPYRVLELLSLPHGPFTGGVGRRMARALRRAPGIGGRAWQEAKERLAEPRDAALGFIAEWLETPGADALAGAPKQELLLVIARVRQWLVARIPLAPEDATLYAGIQQADAVAEALQADGREHFDLVGVRRLAEFVMHSGVRLELVPEQAGRIDHVSSTQALWVPRKTVVWWALGQCAEQPAESGWRRAELAALERAGIRFSPPELRWRENARGFRRAVQAATGELLLVAPRTEKGRSLRSHPLWDELLARLNLDETARARVTRTPADLSSGGPWNVPLETLSPLPLPASHTEWQLELAELPELSPRSASSLSALLGCPFRWALQYLAGLDSEGTDLPAAHLMNGTLGHRLIEELFTQGAFDLPAAEFKARAEREIDSLFESEGAILLRRGKSHERDQVRRQLVDAACSLVQALRDNGLSVSAVERPFEVPWRGAALIGRWDVLATDAAGRRVIIDIKWGQKSYREALTTGSALQLAAYTYALESTEPVSPSALYFSLTSRRLFGVAATHLEHVDHVHGPSLTDTWRRAERTTPLVEQQVAQGRLRVTGLDRSPALLESLGVPEAENKQHFTTSGDQICNYCRFDGLCGKRWEGFR